MATRGWYLASTGLTLAVLVSLSLPCMAINRCTDGKGRVAYQEAACALGDQQRTLVVSGGSPAPAPAPAAQVTRPPEPMVNSVVILGLGHGPSVPASSTGDSGDAVAGQPDAMTLQIRSCGQVIGRSAETGCRLSGRVTDILAGGEVHFDAAMSGCSNSQLNTRYQGQLATSSPSSVKPLHLSSDTLSLALDVKLRR